MSVGALLVGVAIVFVAAVVLADPWTRRRVRGGGGAWEDLEEASPAGDGKAALFALRDLDFDYQTGKIAETDYEPLRSSLLAEAASDLMAADTDENMHPADAQLERAVLNHRKNSAEKSACPHCGRTTARAQRYCSHCGTSLRETCKNCGSSILDQDFYCPACGVRTEDRIGEIS